MRRSQNGFKGVQENRLQFGQLAQVCLPHFAAKLDVHELRLFANIDQPGGGKLFNVMGDGRGGDRATSSRLPM